VSKLNKKGEAISSAPDEHEISSKAVLTPIHGDNTLSSNVIAKAYIVLGLLKYKLNPTPKEKPTINELTKVGIVIFSNITSSQ